MKNDETHSLISKTDETFQYTKYTSFATNGEPRTIHLFAIIGLSFPGRMWNWEHAPHEPRIQHKPTKDKLMRIKEIP